MAVKKVRRLKQENSRLKAQLRELEKLYNDKAKAAENNRQSIKMIYGFVKALNENVW